MTASTRLTLVTGLALMVGISCRDDSAAPTDISTADRDPALLTAATAPPAFAHISAGFLHTCGVATDGRAYCWGSNNFGQFGNGTESDGQLTSIVAAGGLRFRQISAGSVDTCGVTTGSRVYCWGGHVVTPTLMSGGLFFRQVSAFYGHTCGVTTNDVAYCWGGNDQGQLGDGTTTFRPRPVAVVGGLRFRAVSAGRYHSCGVTTTDRAYCWGGDGGGELGDGSGSSTCMFSDEEVPCRRRPSLVAGGYRFRQVDAGGLQSPWDFGLDGPDVGRTCGVTTDNRALCWGAGLHGQLGNGTRSIAHSPKLVSGGLAFRNVSAGFATSCGVTTSNRAYCWGDNSGGAVGDGTTIERLTPRAVAGGLFFREVSAGGFHTCGTTPGNVAYCWRENYEGRLGDGTTMRRLRPRAVVGPM